MIFDGFIGANTFDPNIMQTNETIMSHQRHCLKITYKFYRFVLVRKNMGQIMEES